MTNIQKMSEDFSEEERSRLLAQFESSGLKAHEFAREHNINEGTFRNWVWRNARPDYKSVRHTPVERKKMVEAYLKSGMTKREFCGAWGVSTTSLIEWLSRYEEQGSEGLMDKRRGAKSGMKTSKAIQEEIIALKKNEPERGLKNIKNWLFRFKGVKVSTGTIRKTVKNEGLALATKPKKRRKSSERVRRFERARPMQLWQSDITQFTLGPSSMRVYLTVFMDDHSRYIVGHKLQSRQTAELVIDTFKDACVRFGKPEEVLTDQGRQYFAWRGKSELEKILEKEGIKHVVSRAHHPQTLGKCERFWETVQNEFWSRVIPKDLEEARVRLKHFIDHYNHQRPHQGLDGATPADRFFGVAEEVREIIEKTVEENSLRLAIGELPRSPAFLIGQVGDQRIAFHGTSGQFYLTHENVNGEFENGNHQSVRSVADYAVDSERSGSEPRTQSGGETAACNDAGEASELCHEVKLPCDPGSGIMGSGDGNSAWTSENNCGNNHGVVGGPDYESPSMQSVGHEAHTFLANEQSSNGRHDGGVTDSA